MTGLAESDTPDLKAYMANTLIWSKANVKEITSFKLYSFSAPVTTIDNWISSEASRLPIDRVVAVKIDAEGQEGQILSGAVTTLARQKPLILAESGHRIQLARDVADRLGYVLAERSGNQLYESNKPTPRCNGFFVHPDQFSYYRDIGLMK